MSFFTFPSLSHHHFKFFCETLGIWIPTELPIQPSSLSLSLWMRLVIPYHEDKNFTLTKWKTDLEKFHHCKQTKQKLLCIFSKQLAQVYTYCKLNSVSDTKNLPNLAAAANDANLCLACSIWAFPFYGVFHSTHPPGLVFSNWWHFCPLYTLDFVCNFICRIVPRKPWCWQKQFTGWIASASYFLPSVFVPPFVCRIILGNISLDAQQTVHW